MLAEDVEKILDFDDDVQRLIRWHIGTDARLTRWAMAVGGFNDVVNEVFVSTRNASAVSANCRWTTFICKSASWGIIRLVRKHQRYAELHDLSADIDKDLDLCGSKDRLDRTLRVDDKEVSRLLLGCVDALPDRLRRILRMRYGLGTPALTLSGVAIKLGLSRQRIDQLHKRAIRILRTDSRVNELLMIDSGEELSVGLSTDELEVILCVAEAKMVADRILEERDKRPPKVRKPRQVKARAAKKTPTKARTKQLPRHRPSGRFSERGDMRISEFNREVARLGLRWQGNDTYKRSDGQLVVFDEGSTYREKLAAIQAFVSATDHRSNTKD